MKKSKLIKRSLESLTIKLYQKNTHALLRADETSNLDLLQIAAEMRIESLKVDWLQNYDPSYDGAQILNLGSSSKEREGTHWVAAYRGKYFDSFGLPPPPQLKHLEWVPIQEQSVDQGRCGQWCLIWIWHMQHNEMDKFYTSYKR